MNSTSPQDQHVLTLEDTTTPQSLQDAAALLSTYADSRRDDPAHPLICADIKALPGVYAPPRGALLLARCGGDAMGCVAYRYSDEGICEMKRLYVHPGHRGEHVGLRLCHALLRHAHRNGYTHMRLDSVPRMTEARQLYDRMSFPRTSAYWNNPNPGTTYYEVNLSQWCAEPSHLETYLALVHAALGIHAADVTRQALPRIPETGDLVACGPDIFDRPQRLTRQAALPWQTMRDAAAQDGITLQLVSAFRSIEHQATVIAHKRERGRKLRDVLSVNAAPGYSEHHSGAALDMSTPESEPLTESFEATHAFAWLKTHASRFGFSLSYGRDTPHALVYEPWHWRWAAA